MTDPITQEHRTIKLARGRGLDLRTPLVMGVLNVTPDSFSDGNRYMSGGDALNRVKRLIHEGTDIIDIGGESSRPGSRPVDIDEELRRVIPVIKATRTFSDIAISVDTTKSEVARQALREGADFINDISALRFDREMVSVLKDTGAPVILMHMQGTPQTMQTSPQYDNCVQEIFDFFAERIDFCLAGGLSKAQLVIDPGIGFGKRLEHNLLLLKNLRRFRALGCPVLIGTSRKSFIGLASGVDREPYRRVGGSVASSIIALMNGADIVRVHDVMETVEAVRVWLALEEIE